MLARRRFFDYHYKRRIDKMKRLLAILVALSGPVLTASFPFLTEKHHSLDSFLKLFAIALACLFSTLIIAFFYFSNSFPPGKSLKKLVIFSYIPCILIFIVWVFLDTKNFAENIMYLPILLPVLIIFVLPTVMSAIYGVKWCQ